MPLVIVNAICYGRVTAFTAHVTGLKAMMIFKFIKEQEDYIPQYPLGQVATFQLNSSSFTHANRGTPIFAKITLDCVRSQRGQLCRKTGFKFLKKVYLYPSPRATMTMMTYAPNGDIIMKPDFPDIVDHQGIKLEANVILVATMDTIPAAPANYLLNSPPGRHSPPHEILLDDDQEDEAPPQQEANPDTTSATSLQDSNTSSNLEAGATAPLRPTPSSQAATQTFSSLLHMLQSTIYEPIRLN